MMIGIRTAVIAKHIKVEVVPIMSPEAISWLDKITFTGFLIIALAVLYKDTKVERSNNVEGTIKMMNSLEGIVSSLERLVIILESTHNIPAVPKIMPPANIPDPAKNKDRPAA